MVYWRHAKLTIPKWGGGGGGRREISPWLSQEMVIPVISVIPANRDTGITEITGITGPDSVMVRASASEAGGRGFEPWPRHTKDVKNGTSSYLAWRSAFLRLALASLLPKR